MFLRFGRFIVQTWPALFLCWIVAVIIVARIAPPLSEVVQTGEFAFLPADSPSRIAEGLFAKAFPRESQASTIAIVVRRTDGPLTDADFLFVDGDPPDGTATEAEAGEQPSASSPKVTGSDLHQRLSSILRRHPAALRVPSAETNASSDSSTTPSEDPIITFRNKSAGRFLISPDGKATLVLVQLQREFLDAANGPLVRDVEDLLFESAELRNVLPKGLEVALSGTAVVGRDMLVAARDSAKATEHLTIGLVVVLLMLIYRAPLLAIIPLATVFVSVKLTMGLLCWLAARDLVVLFSGIESYVTVLLYGAGVDYCLFLIARYKEEVDSGIHYATAVADSVGYVGAAIAASAGTVICGIGMMIFAEFGKFHDAGIAISFGLVIVLLASLTFTPVLLRMAGPWVFWPLHRAVTSPREGNESPESESWLQSVWDRIGELLLRRPMTIWLASIVVMLPFAVVGVWFYSDLSYGLLTDLPSSARGVVGTSVLRQHFAHGVTGPIGVIVESPSLDFAESGEEDSGIAVVERASQELLSQGSSLQISDIRSVAFPLGGEEGISEIPQVIRRRLTLQRAVERYVSRTDDFAGRVTRLEVTSDQDPFSRDSIAQLGRIEEAIRAAFAQVTTAPVKIYLLGPTASIRDLKHVTDRDQIRIDILVIAGVFAILTLLLRQPGVCFYLIVSVLFSYLVTLGVTYLAYWWLDGTEFAGLDWKVPMFLFTILIAVGEDYNIFLMSRIHEEQAELGPVQGVIHALSRTGRIISSCGIIMAGTFASLAAGTLKGMSQLGFALAFGVLLDTFVVRPILVPAYLVLLESGRFGRIGRLLGSHAPANPGDPAQERVPSHEPQNAVPKV